MAEYEIDDNGDGSVEVIPAELPMRTWSELMPRKRHWWQPRVWTEGVVDEPSARHRSWLRRFLYCLATGGGTGSY